MRERSALLKDWASQGMPTRPAPPRAPPPGRSQRQASGSPSAPRWRRSALRRRCCRQAGRRPGARPATAAPPTPARHRCPTRQDCRHTQVRPVPADRRSLPRVLAPTLVAARRPQRPGRRHPPQVLLLTGTFPMRSWTGSAVWTAGSKRRCFGCWSRWRRRRAPHGRVWPRPALHQSLRPLALRAQPGPESASECSRTGGTHGSAVSRR
mmetsp:Transcript_58368/g.161426  ORF Transcript_58368/g.161426 Transcript_58368/m.161426 type:complete len:209 (-) Transcript_58368:2827-3453(-)